LPKKIESIFFILQHFDLQYFLQHLIPD